MSLSPQKFREMVLQLLYSQEIGRPVDETMTDLLMKELSVSKKNVRLALARSQSIRNQLTEIDKLISSVSTSYSFDRIQLVTKNILRLGVFELFFDEGIPAKVAISEAIRLSRKFNTTESASFVNALLDELYQSSLGGKVNEEKITELAEQLVDSEQISSKAAEEGQIPENEESIDDDQS